MIVDLLLKMVIFHSYVSLPEGNVTGDIVAPLSPAASAGMPQGVDALSTAGAPWFGAGRMVGRCQGVITGIGLI